MYLILNQGGLRAQGWRVGGSSKANGRLHNTPAPSVAADDMMTHECGFAGLVLSVSGDLYAGRAGAGVVGEAGADQGGLRVGGGAEGGALAPAAGAAGRV